MLISGFPEDNYKYHLENRTLEFMAKRRISFKENGKLKLGTLAKRDQLKNSLGKTKAFKAGVEISFNDKMEVVVKEDVKRRKNRDN
ncbi:hypothetical protein KAJ27_06980 [bacterium]|nr:hypothetical protein [bacterium]